MTTPQLDEQPQILGLLFVYLMKAILAFARAVARPEVIESPHLCAAISAHYLNLIMDKGVCHHQR